MKVEQWADLMAAQKDLMLVDMTVDLLESSESMKEYLWVDAMVEFAVARRVGQWVVLRESGLEICWDKTLVV